MMKRENKKHTKEKVEKVVAEDKPVKERKSEKRAKSQQIQKQ